MGFCFCALLEQLTLVATLARLLYWQLNMNMNNGDERSKRVFFFSLPSRFFCMNIIFHIPRFIMYDVTMLFSAFSSFSLRSSNRFCWIMKWVLNIYFLAGSSVRFCAGRSGGRSQKNMQKRQVCVSFVDWSSQVFVLDQLPESWYFPWIWTTMHDSLRQRRPAPLDFRSYLEGIFHRPFSFFQTLISSAKRTGFLRGSEQALSASLLSRSPSEVRHPLGSSLHWPIRSNTLEDH